MKEIQQKILHNLSKNILTLQLAMEEIDKEVIDSEIIEAVDKAIIGFDKYWSEFKKVELES